MTIFTDFPGLLTAIADAEGTTWAVIHDHQTDKEDFYKIVNKNTGEITIESFPRSMEQTAENVLSYYE